MSDDRIRERDLPRVSPAPTDLVRIVRNGASVTGPAASLPVPTAAQAQIDDLRASQGTGLPGYATVADLPTLTVGDEGQMAWVSNDITASNNGAWRWDGSEWVQSADRTTELEGRTSMIEGGEFPQLSFRMRALDAWTGYGWGVRGSDGTYPLAVDLEGITHSPGVEVGMLNGTGVSRFDSWSGYTWGVRGSNNKYPLVIDDSGSVHIDSGKFNDIEVRRINGEPVATVRPGVYAAGATQEWWISPVHVALTEPYWRVISALYGENGEIIVAESMPGEATRTLVVGSTPFVDDHNAPAIYATPGRRMLVTWTHHGATQSIFARVSGREGSIYSFLDRDVVEVVMPHDTSYTQIHRIEHLCTETEDVYWMLSRVSQFAWGIKPLVVDHETGEIDQSGAYVQLYSASGQMYVSSADAHGSGDQVIRMAVGYNPSSSFSETYYVELNVVTGALTDVEGNPLGALDGTNLPIALSSMTPVLPAVSEGDSRRLFYVRPGPMPPAIAHAAWETASPNDATYLTTEWDGSDWVDTARGPVGPRFGYNETSNYIPGMAFPDPCLDDVVLITRQVDGVDEFVVQTRDSEGGVVERKLAEGEGYRIVRPQAIRGGGPYAMYGRIDSYSASAFTFTGNVESSRW